MRVLGAVLSRSAGSERVRASFSLCEGQRDALSLSSGRGSPSPAAAPCRVRAAVSACVRARVGLRAQRCTHTLCTCGTAGTAKHSGFGSAVGQCLCSCGHPRCCSELFNTLVRAAAAARCASHGTGVSWTRCVKPRSFNLFPNLPAGVQRGRMCDVCSARSVKGWKSFCALR